MIALTLQEVTSALGGRPNGDVPPGSVRRVSTDSRSAEEGDLFFAIRGERFDGHDFVAEALRRGASAAVVSTERLRDVAQHVTQLERPVPPGALIAVSDPVAALGRLAAYHRGLTSASVIAVAGSNGKTTVKAMIDHLLSARLTGHSSPKSFNNAIGVPLTLLSATAADEYMVVEVGTSAPGEIAALAEIARPDMAVLTCIAEEHLDGLGDLRGVAAEECSILGNLEPGGFAAINVDNPLVREFWPGSAVTVASYGWDESADLRVTSARFADPWLSIELNGRFEARLRAPGRHNAVNAAGAITIARRFGFEHEEIAARLESFTLPPMRGEMVSLGDITIINDAYNANPRSALAAFELLESLPCDGRRIVVFGEMRELGRRSAELHRAVGQRLRDGRFARVYLVGTAADLMSNLANAGRGLFGPEVIRCADVAECSRHLRDDLRNGDLVLLKASRAVGLESVLDPLRARFAAPRVV